MTPLESARLPALAVAKFVLANPNLFRASMVATALDYECLEDDINGRIAATEAALSKALGETK